MLISGATFVARGYAGHMDKLEHIMYEAIKHKGFAFVEILQPCVSFNNTWKFYNEKVRWVDETESDVFEALRLCQDETLTGIFYRVSKESYEDAVGEVEAEDVAEVLSRF
jgi:2-oxoglutarate ferredoxin oxidoreductase subunit beta